MRLPLHHHRPPPLTAAACCRCPAVGQDGRPRWPEHPTPGAVDCTRDLAVLACTLHTGVRYLLSPHRPSFVLRQSLPSHRSAGMCTAASSGSRWPEMKPSMRRSRLPFGRRQRQLTASGGGSSCCSVRGSATGCVCFWLPRCTAKCPGAIHQHFCRWPAAEACLCCI